MDNIRTTRGEVYSIPLNSHDREYLRFNNKQLSLNMLKRLKKLLSVTLENKI